MRLFPEARPCIFGYRRGPTQRKSQVTTTPAIENFDQLRRALSRLPGPDTAAGAGAAAREPRLTKPAGALGRLEELSKWLSEWQGRHPPALDAPHAHVFAANHGVAARGVSAYPADVTAQMVANFEAGGAAITKDRNGNLNHLIIAVRILQLTDPFEHQDSGVGSTRFLTIKFR